MLLPTRFQPLRWILRSLLVSLMICAPLRAAERLEVRLDGLHLPVDLSELEAWSADPTALSSDLRAWLDLLSPAGRLQLLRLLKLPVLRDRSFAQQFLGSWAGRRALEGLDDLISSERGGSGELLHHTLQRLMAQQGQVTLLELLRAVPTQSLVIDLDGGLALATGWQQQLLHQREAMAALRMLPLLPVSNGAERALVPIAAPVQQMFSVAHRPEPLPLQIWRGSSRAWVMLTPGLGGSAEQLAWLAEGLHQRGWSVLLMDHPGSDDQAVRDLLEGRRPPPGADTLPGRVKDLQAVVAAVERGALPRLGEEVVLMGHSLGGLTSLLAAGLRPEPGLARRCEQALDDLPLANLSWLLQCQLVDVPLTAPTKLAQPIHAVVAFNGFGSLLWPHRGLKPLHAPVLLVGGSLDLITPPIREQLHLFLPWARAESRFVLLDGGSHFSPVRLASNDEALFQLGEEFVGVEPLRVQSITLTLTSEFLAAGATGIKPQRRQFGGVTAYVLNRHHAKAWQRSFKN